MLHSPGLPNTRHGDSIDWGERALENESIGAQGISNDDRSPSEIDLWSRTLSRIPTSFGRLVYLAGLIDVNSGRYKHFGLVQVYSEQEAHEALRKAHAEVFGEWLNYPLRRQRGDLESYLESLEGDREMVLRSWLHLTPYRSLIPAGASDGNRQLYIADLELILEILRNETFPP